MLHYSTFAPVVEVIFSSVVGENQAHLPTNGSQKLTAPIWRLARKWLFSYPSSPLPFIHLSSPSPPNPCSTTTTTFSFLQRSPHLLLISFNFISVFVVLSLSLAPPNPFPPLRLIHLSTRIADQLFVFILVYFSFFLSFLIFLFHVFFLLFFWGAKM